MTGNKKRNLYIIGAVLSIICFCVCVYFMLNPAKANLVLNGGFDETSDFVKFTDVGQGDSAIIYSNGYSAVIDMGLPNFAPDIYEDLSKYSLKEIDAVLISHLHSDHLGGLQKVAENYKIKNLIMPEILDSSIAAAKNARTFITNNGGSAYNAVAGMNFEIGEFNITVLGFLDDKKNENNRSVFTVAEKDGAKFLFTGDAETKAEQYILNQKLNLDCDVLKVSHHGSNSSTCREFLNATTPDYAVISVGEDNMYNHPNSETLEALKSINAEIYRTDLCGDITFDLSDGNIKINTEKQ